METRNQLKKFAGRFAGLILAVGLVGACAQGHATKASSTQTTGGHTERVLDYRHGQWFRQGVAISRPGQCPAEDSCQPVYAGGRWTAARRPADVECDDYEVAGQVECIHGTTGEVWQPGS